MDAELARIGSKFFPDLMPKTKTVRSKKTGKLKERELTEDELADLYDAEYGESFDVRTLIDESRDPLTGAMRDLKIDDRDIPLATNFYDFCFNHSGPASNPPWSRQMWTMLKFFGEICPRCSNKKWLRIENIPKSMPARDLLSDLVLLEHGVCPKCKRTRRKLVRTNQVMDYREAVLVWGQRSGKSTTLVKGVCYHTHKFLKFPNFSTMVNTMQASTPLVFSFVSLTYGKAMSVMWTPFIREIESNEWYKNYFEMLDYTGKKAGKELYDFKKEYLRFTHKNMRLSCAPPNLTTLRGETRFGAAMDELGLFALPKGEDEEDEQGARANADEAHKSLDNSLLTVRTAAHEIFHEQRISHVPTGIMLGVSSPMSEKDKVMRLLKDSQGEVGSKYIFGSQLPTWEVNPAMNRDNPDIVMAYERNAAKAERDFGANPPRIASPFVSNQIITPQLFSGKPSSHTIKYNLTNKETQGILRHRWKLAYPSLMSLDAGEVNNSFTVTVLYIDPRSGNTVCSTVLELMPAKGRRINHNKMYNSILLPLAKDNNVKVVLADRWNSLDILQRLAQDAGCKTQQISVNRKDFDFVVSMMEDGSIVLPQPEMPMHTFIDYTPDNYRQYFVNKPVAHLAHQFTTIQDAGPGKCPEKGHGYTDDIVRSFVLGASRIHHPKILEILKKASKKSNGTGGKGMVYVSRMGI